MSDSPDLHDEIRALLTAPTEGEDAPSLSVLENTLTDGYARALALEAERKRIQRRIGEVGIELGYGRSEHVDELAALARRLDSADGDIESLRDLLGTLRRRASEHRSASKP